MSPVSRRRRTLAEDHGLVNVDQIAITCREAGVPFFVACALFSKESSGRNVYGHDVGGALSGFELPVNRHNFAVFRWMVLEHGHLSNGVGPSQITYAGSVTNGKRSGGYFKVMEDKGLEPWDVHDNMLFGLQILKGHYDRLGTWEAAGTAYNGKASYGADLADRIADWKKLLG